MSVVSMVDAKGIKKGEVHEEIIAHEISDDSKEVREKKATHRLNLALPEKAANAIFLIQDRLEASTTSEAIRRSLLLTLTITDAIKDGGKVVIERADGTREIILLG